MAFYYPTGIILPFDTVCPSGWTTVTGLENTFLKGSSTYGTTGGSTNHRHKIDFGTVYTARGTETGIEAASGTNLQTCIPPNHKHFFINVIVYSNYIDNSPPYVNVVFCKKN